MSAAWLDPVVPAPQLWLRYSVVLPTALIAGLVVGLVGHSILPVALVPALAAVWVLRGRSSVLRRQAAAQRNAVVTLCSALRAELDGGALPSAALAEAVWCRVELRDLAELVSGSRATQRPASIRFPGDAAGLLAAAARAAPGREGLSGLAACWRATEEHGLSLTAAVAGIESALRADEQRQLLLDSELSGVRTTMGLLAVLPVFGLVLGSGLGTRPLHILLQTFGGQVCLVVGSTLEMAGLWWTDRLVASVSELAAPMPGRVVVGGPVAEGIAANNILANAEVPSTSSACVRWRLHLLRQRGQDRQ